MVVVSGLMMLMGLAIAAVWTRDIVAGDKIDLSAGLWQARDGAGDGTLLWPHWIAEYATAGLLIAGGIGLLANTGWARPIAGVGLGALFYTSVNSLGWALAQRDRYAYAAPMVAGVLVSFIGAVWLLAG